MSRGLFSWRDYAPFFSVSLSSCLAQKGHPGRNALWMTGLANQRQKEGRSGLKWDRSNQSAVWVILFGNWGTHSLKGVQAVWNIRWERGDGAWAHFSSTFALFHSRDSLHYCVSGFLSHLKLYIIHLPLTSRCCFPDLISLISEWGQASAVKALNPDHQATRELPTPWIFLNYTH